MNEFKGTPGPWVVDIRGGCVAVYPDGEQWETPGCHRSDERNIAYSDKGAAYDEKAGYWSMDKKTVHDYTLIAAAPELLEALQLLMAEQTGGNKSCGHNGFTCMCSYNKARAAISKALVEPQ